MQLSENTTSKLKEFQIDPIRGFLPSQNPISQLPASHRLWDEAVAQLPDWMEAEKQQEELNKMEQLSIEGLSTLAEQERAMLILSFLGHAYLVSNGEKPSFLPPQIGVPWFNIATKLGRRPALSHASLDLQNFKVLDSAKAMIAENLALQVRFGKEYDEDWFFLVTTEIEAAGGMVPGFLLEMQEAIAAEKDTLLEELLSLLADKIELMLKSLMKMNQHCRPDYFYHQIRPCIDSIIELEYRGLENPVKSYAGGSAAQSSLPQAIDAALGIVHTGSSGAYLKDMRNYMPPKHKAFIEWLEKHSSIQSYCQKSSALSKGYAACVKALQAFRNYHLRIVSEYIIKPSGMESAKGTGGTDAMDFLKEVRNDTRKSID